MSYKNIISATLLIASVSLGFGLFLPVMTIVPGYGEYTAIVSFFEPKLGVQQSYSIVDSIVVLAKEGKYFITFVIIVFSVVFPFWKLTVLWHAYDCLDSKSELDIRLKNIERLAKFSMIDIFVIALLVVIVKGLPGGTQIHLGWGIVAFTVSILLSMFIPKLMRNYLKPVSISSPKSSGNSG